LFGIFLPSVPCASGQFFLGRWTAPFCWPSPISDSSFPASVAVNTLMKIQPFPLRPGPDIAPFLFGQSRRPNLFVRGLAASVPRPQTSPNCLLLYFHFVVVPELIFWPSRLHSHGPGPPLASRRDRSKTLLGCLVFCWILGIQVKLPANSNNLPVVERSFTCAQSPGSRFLQAWLPTPPTSQPRELNS